MTTDEDGEVLARLEKRLANYDQAMKVGAIYPNADLSEQFANDLRALLALIGPVMEENERLRTLINTPEVDDWAKGAVLEAGHQRERWGVDYDAGKSPFDWFWLIGYLAQKAAASAVAGDTEKAKHHTISTGAALANWHLALSGIDTRMRPGIDPEREQAA